jgi:hypothetical protein
MKVVIKGDVYAFSDKESFHEFMGEMKSGASNQEKKIHPADDEILNRPNTGKLKETVRQPIVMNDYSVEGCMNYLDELYERSLKSTTETIGNKKVVDFFGLNAADYKTAAMALRNVLKRVDEWEKENGPGSVPTTHSSNTKKEETFADALIRSLRGLMKK